MDFTTTINLGSQIFSKVGKVRKVFPLPHEAFEKLYFGS
jgi:hypothetical protein